MFIYTNQSPYVAVPKGTRGRFWDLRDGHYEYDVNNFKLTELEHFVFLLV